MACDSRSELKERESVLEFAGRIREARENLIEHIRAGDLELHLVLESSDPLTRAVKVVTVIENLPSLGKVKARRVLGEVGIPANLKIDDLDDHRRKALIRQIETSSAPDSYTRSPL